MAGGLSSSASRSMLTGGASGAGAGMSGVAVSVGALRSVLRAAHTAWGHR